MANPPVTPRISPSGPINPAPDLVEDAVIAGLVSLTDASLESCKAVFLGDLLMITGVVEADANAAPAKIFTLELTFNEEMADMELVSIVVNAVSAVPVGFPGEASEAAASATNKLKLQFELGTLGGATTGTYNTTFIAYFAKAA